MLDAIKNAVKDWPERNKYCSISWDEVSLKEHLDYCTTQDNIEGFVELASPRKPIFATHALTFMIRGINVLFKQSAAYFYTHGLCSFELVELVKLMIEALSTTGMSILHPKDFALFLFYLSSLTKRSQSNTFCMRSSEYKRKHCQFIDKSEW